MLKIDMHSHIMPKHIPRWADKFGYDGFIHLEHHKKGWADMMQGEKFFREINENCWDGAVRIREYQKYELRFKWFVQFLFYLLISLSPKTG